MREGVTLQCNECKQRNYRTTKNKKNTTDRLELKSSAELTPLTERPGKDVRAMAVSESGKPGLISRISRFFKEVRSELRKVAWPNRKELTSYTILVLVTVAVVAVYIGVIDFVVRVALGLILG